MKEKLFIRIKKLHRKVTSSKQIIIICLCLSFIFLSLKTDGLFLKELIIGAAVIGLALLNGQNKNLINKN